MTTHDGSGEIDPGSTPEIYNDLAKEIAFVFDDAFNMEAEKLADDQQRIRDSKLVSTVEIVQKDVTSLGIPAFTVLQTPSGGKPTFGVEKIKLFAYSTGNYSHVLDAAIANQSEDGELAYSTGEFFVAHQLEEGAWRYSRTDGSSLTPWVPAHVLESDLDFAGGLDVIHALNQTIHGPTEFDKLLEPINIAYAEELMGKISVWPIVPQN